MGPEMLRVSTMVIFLSGYFSRSFFRAAWAAWSVQDSLLEKATKSRSFPLWSTGSKYSR